MILLFCACFGFGRGDVGVSTSVDVEGPRDSERCEEPAVCAGLLLGDEPTEADRVELEDSEHSLVAALACQGSECCTEDHVAPGSYVVVGEREGVTVAAPVLVPDDCETALVELDFAAK